MCLCNCTYIGFNCNYANCRNFTKGVSNMSNSNKIILKSVAKLAKSAARCASGAASFFDFHQPKEPENLKAMLNSEEKK
ncbi:cyclic lactone autoinducer peptide [Ruminococcus sp. OM06-36AC]|nr:cyclic lactone autoinducer peptide [Ruminococcus sp. OM06-36AC]